MKKIFSLLFLSILVFSFFMPCVQATSFAHIIIHSNGMGNITATYSGASHIVMYSEYVLIGEENFKSKLVSEFREIGWIAEIQNVIIKINQPGNTMTVSFPIKNFAQKRGMTWKIDLDLIRTIYPVCTEGANYYVFLSPTTPELPMPKSISIELPNNAFNSKFNKENYSIVYQLTGGCLIVTALTGSPLSQEVQFLRHFRDDTLVRVFGHDFVNKFNSWYYSFSPSVAQFIQENSWTRIPAITILSPMIWFLRVLDTMVWFIMH